MAAELRRASILEARSVPTYTETAAGAISEIAR